jgi:V8-like Glu-specific endopeptidase
MVMKQSAFVLSALISVPALAGVDVIYGTDDRKDIYETTSALHLKLAKSTAGMIKKSMFIKGANATSFDLKEFKSLERANNVCTREKFSQQPLAAMCSGFLVGPDTLITAGHCYNTFDLPENVCKDFAWVFDFNMKSANHNPTKNFSINNIYNCKQVVAIQRDALYDFAVIKLERKVIGREPLKFRTSGKINDNDPMVVIGHPTGLPLKIAGNGKVTNNSEMTRFSTNLDTFHGNSGSAVFNSTTGQVEGILIMGKNDYIPSNPSNPRSCKVNNICDNNANNCKAGFEPGPIQYGEVVLRIEKINTFITKSLLMK